MIFINKKIKSSKVILLLLIFLQIKIPNCVCSIQPYKLNYNVICLSHVVSAQAFLTILIVNRLSYRSRIILYGHKISTPSMNVIQTIFGLSQARLPRQNFSRFILTLFVGFCLIFRTCFQSKFFEFMTSEPRRLPPQSIEELIDRKYELYAIMRKDLLIVMKDKYGRK